MGKFFITIITFLRTKQKEHCLVFYAKGADSQIKDLLNEFIRFGRIRSGNGTKKSLRKQAWQRLLCFIPLRPLRTLYHKR